MIWRLGNLAIQIFIALIVLALLYFFVFADFIDWAFSSVPSGALEAITIFIAIIFLFLVVGLATQVNR